jgi:hypothetical protein
VTKLLVETLESGYLSQEVRLRGSDRYHVGAFIPYIYLHNAPLGTFNFILEKDSVILFQKSFTSAEIKTSMGTASDYIHCFYPIIPTNPVQLESGLYTIKLTSTGYSNSSTSFIGWIRQFEDLNNTLDYVPLDDDHNPLAIRLKIYKRGIK